MKTALFALLFALCAHEFPPASAGGLAELPPALAELPPALAGGLATRPAYIVFHHNRGPVKIYAATEDCILFCGTANRRESDAGRPGIYSDQQVNIYYQTPEDGWQPGQRDILEDYNRPQGLPDKFLEQKTVYIVMQEHFELGLRIYADSAACYSFAASCARSNWQPVIRKLPYFYRSKKSYDEIWRIRESRLR